MQAYSRLDAIYISGRCARCDAPLPSAGAVEGGAICRPCLRIVNANVAEKRLILLAQRDAGADTLSTWF